MVLSMKRWSEKVAVVTGASSGIGAAIVEQLVQNGLRVVGLARRVDRVEELAHRLADAKGVLHPFKADISKEDEVVKAFKWVEANVGPVHVLVNNAGVNRETTLIDGAYDDWKTVFDVNVLGLCVATREAVRMMRKHDINGHIVHINSVAGHTLIQFPKINVYPASKFAVTALTEVLRQELRDNNTKIKITSVSPGLVSTEMTDLNPNLGQERTNVIKDMPILKAEDIADGVIYALSTPEHVQIHELTIKPVGETF